MRNLATLLAFAACVAPASAADDSNGGDSNGAATSDADAGAASSGGDSLGDNNSNMHTVNSSQFDDFADANRARGILLVLHAPWCGHCKALKPALEEAGRRLAREDAPGGHKNAVIAWIDATAEPELARKYNVSGYPTLKWISPGDSADANPEEVDAGRDADGIYNFLKRKTSPALEWLPKSTDLEAKYLDPSTFGPDESAVPGEMLLVGKFARKSVRAREVEKLAATYRDVPGVDFRAIPLPKGADAKADSVLHAVVRHTRGKGSWQSSRTTKYNGGYTSSKLNQFVEDLRYPSELRLAEWNTKKYSEAFRHGKTTGGRNLLVVLLNKLSADDSEHAVVRDALVAAGADVCRTTHAAKGGFCALVSGDDALDTEAKKLLLTEGADGEDRFAGSPAALVVLKFADDGTPTRYQLALGKEVDIDSNASEAMADVTDKVIRDFVSAAKGGDATPVYRSAPRPTKEVDEDGVIEVVASTFQEHIVDSKKDSLVLYYAPWCGHCKTYHPVHAEVARVVRDKLGSGVQIVKFDATSSETVEPISGYPKLVLYKAQGKGLQARLKHRSEFNGERSRAGVLGFLADAATSLKVAQDSIDSVLAGDEKVVGESMVQREIRQRKAREAAQAAAKKKSEL